MKSFRVLSLGAALLGVAVTVAAGPVDPLESGFNHPPDSAKPQTWWHWMNGNISKEGITADLEAMKQIGIGGATIVNADCGIPAGSVPFMSPAWRDDFKFAVSEANRLGLELTVENCAGWSSSGGPWNTPEVGMKRITFSELQMTGPVAFAGRLPQPPTKLDYYRDIAVLAFPISAGGSVSMKAAAPVVTANDGKTPIRKLTDGDVGTVFDLPMVKGVTGAYVQLEFKAPFKARAAKIITGESMPECSGVISYSADGNKYQTAASFKFDKRSAGAKTFSLGSEPVTARFWRLQFRSIAGRTKGTSFPLAEIELTPQMIITDLGNKAGFDGRPVAAMPASYEAGEGVIQRQGMVDLTSHLSADGKLTWDVPAGDWVIQRFGYTAIGVKNHPAPESGTGLECDKLSKSALDWHWAGFMQKVLDDIKPLGGKGLSGSLIDSYEVGGQNWTPAFREEFLKRRGYDLLTWLPAFTGRVVDNPAVTERFLWDVRRTIADLFAENYFGHFAELCRQHGLINAVEPYEGPFESIQSGAPADFVMGEFWSGTQGHPSVKLVSSIAHIYGKTYVGAESFTASPKIAGRWTEDMYGLKALGDLVYCQGLNRYVFHRYAMQPWMNRWPGMTMGQWGFHFERTETWWGPGKAWIDYISHCQFLLQQGQFVADAAYFNGESAPSMMRDGNPKLPAGYDYDGVNADVLLHGATVKDGRIVLASGASYAVLVLPPNDPDMTPQILQRIDELVEAGATVVGVPPKHSPSLGGYPECDAQVKQLAAKMWGNCDGQTVVDNACGQGHATWGKPLAGIFADQHLPPDFEFADADADAKLLYCHRHTDTAEIYFVSNQRHQNDTADCTFRVIGKTPELWHPDTGVIERAPVWHEQAGRTTVRLTFDPAGSVFVIFRSPASGNQIETANVDAQWQTVSGSAGELVVKATGNGTAEFRTVDGKTLKATAAGLPTPQTLSGAWTVNFPPNWGAPASVTLDKLISWTEHPDNGVKYFSGTASYEKDLDISADRLTAGRELWLDLGAVKNFAEVSLNGQNLGVLWKPPFRANLTSAAKPGVNKLVVKVTNLWPNRLIGDEQLPPDVEWNGLQLAAWPQWLLDGKPSPTGRLTFTTWHHWKKTDQPLVSGLLGPVRLQTAQVILAQ